MRRLRRLAALAVAGALAGCGGGGPDRLGAAEYRTRANEICRAFDRRAEAIARPAPGDTEALLRYVERLLPLGREQVRQVRALEPPEALAERHERLAAAADDVVAEVERLRDAAERGDGTAAAEAVEAGRAANARANALARELGLEACVEEG